MVNNDGIARSLIQILTTGWRIIPFCYIITFLTMGQVFSTLAIWKHNSPRLLAPEIVFAVKWTWELDTLSSPFTQIKLAAHFLIFAWQLTQQDLWISGSIKVLKVRYYCCLFPAFLKPQLKKRIRRRQAIFLILMLIDRCLSFTHIFFSKK